MQRISVIGNSGSGKTTLARQLSAALGIAHLELDGVFHQPGWQELDTDAFRDRVAAFTSGPAWVVDGNYSRVLDIVWDRADTVILLDLPRGRVMRQVTGRTLRRLVTRAELWNGNREPWTNILSFRPEKSVIAWSWASHGKYQSRFQAAQEDPALRHLTFIRLRTARQIADLVRTATAAA